MSLGQHRFVLSTRRDVMREEKSGAPYSREAGFNATSPIMLIEFKKALEIQPYEPFWRNK